MVHDFEPKRKRKTSKQPKNRLVMVTAEIHQILLDLKHQTCIPMAKLMELAVRKSYKSLMRKAV